MSFDFPRLTAGFLQMQGLNTAAYKPENTTTYGLENGDFGNAGNRTLDKSGSYYVSADNRKSADTIELSNKNNIFAVIDTDKSDTVKLDGSGWKQVDDRDNNPKSHTYINKETNSAVTVYGDGKVTNEKGEVIP